MRFDSPPPNGPTLMEFAVVRLANGHAGQVAIGALPRRGRLPVRATRVIDAHIELTCADNEVELIGSMHEPLDADVLAQARSPEGLWFAEIDEVTGAPVATERLLGATQ